MKIGNKKIGDGVFITAEIGINHNGNLLLAKSLIEMAANAGCDAVKFQKRTVEDVYTKEELNVPRESPWGTTNREQKYGIEFNLDEYDEIDRYCKEKGILWFASCWDKFSVDFIDRYRPPCYKIPSAQITDLNLLHYTSSKGVPMILSTGMSTEKEIQKAIQTVEEFTDEIVILHCTSTYPSAINELNLKVIETFKKKYKYPIGYSGHEVGVVSSIIAASMGACMIERHITLDRAMYGSDQAASLEEKGLKMMVSNIRELPIIIGDGIKRVYESEIPIMKKLRK